MIARLARAGSFLLAFALLVAAAAPARAQGMNILDLYRELQAAQPNGFPTYDIEPGRRGPTATGGLLYGTRARLSVVLDMRRYYLRITDRGDADTADGMVTEVAAWIDPEGAPLVGLSEWGVKDGQPFAGRLRFYSRATGRWNLVTGQVWPTMDSELCRTEPQEVVEDTAAWEGLGRLVAVLPRSGTDIQAWCVGPSPVADTGVAMRWEPAAGKFVPGPALNGPPPWQKAGRGR